jgi:sugar lactone lactonase YvrE
MIQVPGNVKFFASSVAISLVMLLAGCGGGGGGGAPATPTPSSPDIPLALMVDGMGRQLPEAEFGHGDALAAGADGIAFDDAPIANAPVTLADSGGVTRTTTTDALGYYRLDIKGLRPPFVVKVKRADGSEWFSASNSAVATRAFAPIHINGLTDKTLGYVADVLVTGGGAASAVTATLLASNPALLDQARATLRVALAVPLANAGFDAASYDPAAAALVPASADKHAAFLRGLRFGRSGAGRTTVIGTITGTARTVSPVAVAVDGAGNMYVADDETSSIRKFSPAGVETRLAVPAGAKAIALDAQGNLFVADTWHYAILKVTAAGVVSTLAGGAGSGFADGTGSAAKFAYPYAIAVDRSGNVYVCDTLNRALRKITPAGVVTTVAGAAVSGPLSVPTLPYGVAVDGADNVYFTNSGEQTIVRMTPAGVRTDWYRAPAGVLFFPQALAVDAAGTVYAVNYGQIVRVTAGGVASTLAGASHPSDYGSADGQGTAARFEEIRGIAIDANGDVLVADTDNEAIRRVTPGGDVTTMMGKKAPGFIDGPAASASFSGKSTFTDNKRAFVGIAGVAVDASGDIYLADTGNNAIRRIARSGAVTTVAGNGTPGFANGNGRSASFNGPTGVAIDAAGNLYVADKNNNAVRKISASGDVSTLAAAFDRPTDIAVGADGTVYVSDGSVVLVDGSDGKPTIRRISAAGVVSTFLSNDALPPVPDLTPTVFGPIAVDPSGTVLVKTFTRQFGCDICGPGRPAFGGILAISPGGVVTQRTNILSAQLATVNSLAADRDGNAYELLLKSDGRAMTLVRHTPLGVTTDIAVDGIPPKFDNDGHIAVDANGNVVVVDATSSAIRIVLP